MQYLTTATDSALPVAVILYGNRDFGNKGLPYDWRGNHSTPLIAEQLDKTYLSDMSWGHFPWSESEVQAEIMDRFVSRLLSESTNMPVHYAELVDENLLDLI